jgi:hypothetical protein
MLQTGTTRAPVRTTPGLALAATAAAIAVVATVPAVAGATASAAAGQPAITSISVSKSSVDYVGGTIHLIVNLANTRSCQVSISPNVSGFPLTSPCAAATKSWAVALPENSSSSPMTYDIAVQATGSGSEQTTASTSVEVAAVPPPCPGVTSTATPTTTAFFNDPSTGSAADRTTVVDAEINLICQAQLPQNGKPTTINAADFVYQLDQVTQALLWAHRYMHADVHVVLDGTNEWITAPDGTVTANAAYDDLLAGLPEGSVVLCGPNAGTPPPPPRDGIDDVPRVFPAGTGCAGNNIMHTKLLMVSAVDAARDPAVFSNSQNFSQNAITKALNNGLQIVGNRPLYNQQAAYFVRLTADANNQEPNFGGNFSSASTWSRGAFVRSEFWPQNSPAEFPAKDVYSPSNDAATDSVARLLDTVRCTAPGKYAGTHSGRTPQTKVRLAMYSFQTRPAVTAALDALQAAGCDVKLIYAGMSKQTMNDLHAHGIDMTQLNEDAFPYTDGSGSGRVFVHDKYLLISGRLDMSGKTLANQTLVQTGSPNLTQNGLHFNDEAGVVYRQAATATGTTPVYAAYESNWDHLAAIAASIPPAAPEPGPLGGSG